MSDAARAQPLSLSEVPCDLMARATGTVLERRRDETIVYALRFRAYGKRRYLTLGSKADGWTRKKAEEELQNVLADVRRGLWRPPRPPSDETIEEPTFHEFASEWFEAFKDEGVRPMTPQDYEWQLCNHLLPYFASHRLSEITTAQVGRYRQHKVREGRFGTTSIKRLAQVLDVGMEGS